MTGISGQSGSYLAEFLLEKGYEVYGTLKRNSIAENQTARLNNTTYEKIKNGLQFADMTDVASLMRVVNEVKPHEIYNLAAQSHVRVSFDQPLYTLQATGLGVMNLLEVIRQICPEAKLYQASSSEMFGNSIDLDGYQRETTPMNPVSPYGCAKLLGYNLVKCYRESYGLFASNGILFNHESPRRGTNFVSNKVVIGAVKISKGLQEELVLGNLDSSRDWGHAKDYVSAMWSMLQLDKPDDYVVATGKSHTVKELCDFVFAYLGMNYKDYVVTDEKYKRPLELNDLKGDMTKFRNASNIKFEYDFETLLTEMIEYWKEQL